MKIGNGAAKMAGLRGSARHIAIFALLVVALAAAGYFGWNQYRQARNVQGEADAQKKEIEECRTRMASIFKAFGRYAADHKGRAPGRFADLVPKYIADPKMLMCPTAERWIGKGASMQCGSLDFNGKPYPVTYGFLCFTASYPITLRKNGDKTVLVTCSAHQEGMYQSAYHRPAPTGVFEASQRNSLASEVRDTHRLVLRKSGVIELQNEEQ